MFTVTIDHLTDCELYTSKAFAGGIDARAVLETAMSDKAREDRAQVLTLLKQGESYENAVAAFDTDENFEQWYQQLEESLQAALA